jgi:hypothetical protein
MSRMPETRFTVEQIIAKVGRARETPRLGMTVPSRANASGSPIELMCLGFRGVLS